MPIYRGARVALFVVALLLIGCSASLFKSRDIRLRYGETTILVLESGAVIVSRRQVATLGPDGKLADSRGRPVAYLSADGIRLRGGTSVPIRKDADGTVRIPEQAQLDAGLKPITHRVRPDGTMAQTRHAAGVEVQGAVTERNRRVILLVLLLTANSLWELPPG